MKRLALEILKLRLFVWPSGVAIGLLAITITYFSAIPDIIVHPDLGRYSWDYYSDDGVGGQSQILEFVLTDSMVRLEFILKEGFHSPYVGVSITPKTAKYIDARRSNQIDIRLKGDGIERVGVALFVSSYSYQIKPLQDNALYHSYLNISANLSTYSIPIKQLRHPEWWEDLNRIPEGHSSRPDLSRIETITIGSAFSPSIGSAKALEVHSVSFTRNNSRLFTLLSLGAAAFILLLFGVHCLVLRFRRNGGQITVLYKPTQGGSKAPSEGCVEYINNHFASSNLSLDLVSKATSQSQRQVANTISSQFGCNFKTYINRIRITESKRLLGQTDMNIGEIAFGVGFNNQSHFNRVFRGEVGMSPGEYRDKHRK